jgi:hypothetical protein
MRANLSLWPAGALLVLAAASCSRSGDQGNQMTTSSTQTTTERRVVVSRIDLGRGVSADHTVTETSETFTPRETVYAAVVTSGSAPTAELTARWTTLDGGVIDETTQTISPTGPETVNEFHIDTPTGLEPGRYRLEIFIDGDPAGTKEFVVSNT